ncbi:carboxymethylenebutenolidase [Actinoplanes ianthinogenes]|uniref:Carboxymethylenebutenolidase n=1 Tax=Actinoplanes ianthinogenes TaxID=122358 RepID=A0ABM7M7E3_9ACTN|nr:dienelactone hydrolase family protein [Actinoplanes ianthinogenes]BCJ47587.1 carboxymethylenebutenolidase [Actinoplanes ianthinogenes]GGR02783.1 carboxymethylenebutenolidase [Actinoplanes ianthinogenes]
MSVQNVTFPSNGGQAHGYLQLPEAGTGPGVIVIQEWWGLTDHIADITRRLAAEGFVALAPDLYGGATTHDAAEAQQLMTEMPADRAAKDLAGAVDFLLAQEAVTSSTVGVIGFCMGGGFVLQLAADRPEQVSAAVPFYGFPQNPDEVASRIRGAVQGHYATKDRIPLDAVRDLFGRLKNAELHVYEAGHAFLNDENLIGTHDPEAAKLAWSRAVAFLHEHVGS